jgi:hypothetical protein
MGRKRKEYFLIDAYNVINDWPELKALRDNLEFARDRLVAVLEEYGAYERYDITVVFDALFTNSQESVEEVNSHMRLIYTDEGETADSCIEKLAYTLVRQDKEVYVVTSDYAEQTVILGAGAYRISSRELRRNIKKTKKKITEEFTVENPLKVSRRELGGRISLEAAKKLDALRKGKH